MSVALRPYQYALIHQAREAFASSRTVLLQAPTGSGKTVIAAHIARAAFSLGKRVWILVHRRELVDQVCAALRTEGCPYWVSSAGWRSTPDETRGGVMVGSIPTIARRDGGNKCPDMVIWDEAHHIVARSWASIFQAYPSARHLGLTATPIRIDGSGLGGFFEHLIVGPPIQALIDASALAPYRMYCPSQAQMGSVHLRGGEYVTSEAEAAVSHIIGDVVSHYQKFSAGKQALIFCVSLAHSREIVNAFVAHGILARHVDGDTDPVVRKLCVDDFRAGRIRVLSNVSLFGEGVDLPGVETLIMLRPTMSLGLYLQQVGRVLRYLPGKTAIILDHVGNIERHGLPNAPQKWQLSSPKIMKPASDSEKNIRVRTCTGCWSAQAPAAVCRYCGKPFDLKGRKIECVEGELVEIIQPKPKWGNEAQLSQMLSKKMPKAMAISVAKKIIRSRGGKNVGVPSPSFGMAGDGEGWSKTVA
jgi:superfamily II DNA or RNA helicase